jgi:hypothetical protein
MRCDHHDAVALVQVTIQTVTVIGSVAAAHFVDAGGIEFMRPWAEHVYGIPPEQVVGSSVKTKFEMRDGKPVLVSPAGVELRR